MKKGWLLALGLVCGAVFPLNTFATDDGIYETNDNGTALKTVIYGNTKITIKMSDEPGPQYYRGFNKNRDNSVFDDTNNPGQGTYIDEGDGKMHGGTYGVNDAWGGSGDNYTNGFDNGNEKYLRRGACDTGYHIPSRGEWNTLVTAWCSISETCNARYSDTQINGVTGDLIKATKRSDENKLVYMSGSLSASGFRTAFNMTLGIGYRSSSPDPEKDINAYRLYTISSKIDPGDSIYRDHNYRVRCFKDEVVYPSEEGPEFPDVPESGVTITHHPDSGISYSLNGNENFTVGTFTITDGTTKITMLDRNLGALVAGTGVESYGYHFQWGNNYGFDPMDPTVEVGAVNVSTDGAKRKSSYVNSGYYGEVFIKSNSEYGNDYWEKRSGTILENYYQLRGGNIINDGLYFNLLKKNQARLRQGPCPEGFHVPSIGEWNKLLSMMAGTTGEKASMLHDNLLIPFAGVRDDGNAEVSGLGERTALWSSSPYGNEHESRAIGLSDGRFDTADGYRAAGASIRCFYNEYDDYIDPQPVTNIDISNIPEPTIGGHGVTWVINITPTPANSIEILGDGYEPSWWAETAGSKCLLGGLYCDGVFSGEGSQWTSYYLRILYNPTRGYKVGDNLTVTTDSTRHNNITAKYEPADGFYSIKITYLPSEIPMGIERINLSGNIIPLVHGTIPTKDITTDTPGVSLGNITWGKGDDCTPLAEGETIDASNSKYCLSIDITTASGYTTTFDYEIFLNNGHRIGYYDGDGAYACTSSLIKNQKIVPNYKIEFISSGEVIDTRYREHGCTLALCTNLGDSLRIPHRHGYTFSGWFSDSGFNNEWDWNNDQIVNNISLYAKWIKDSSGNGENGGNVSDPTISGYSGGGKHIIDTSNIESEEGSGDNNTENRYSSEFVQAYNFAFENGITTMDSIDKADMEGGLTRIAMAKMLSQYAINVLGKKPTNIVVPRFLDVNSELDEEYDFGVTLSYQLGIMGIGINEFRPFDFVTRAEFATALSRILFSTPDGDPYYSTHIEKLKSEGIIKVGNPDLQEMRGYVMIMLMRSKFL